MSDLDNLKDKYEGKKEKNLADTIKDMKDLTAQLGGKKQSAPVRAAKQAISGFRSQWSGIDEKGNVGVGKGVPGIYYDTVAIPALAGIVDDKYAPEFAVEADKKAGKIREGVRKDMGIEAPRGALEHFANAGGTMLGQLPVPGAWLKRVLTPVKEAGIAGKVATSPIEYLSPIVDPKKINYGVGTGFGGTIGVVGEALEEEPIKKALGGLIQKYEDGGKVGKVKSFFSAVDKAIDTLKQKKGTGEQILKEIEKAPGVKKEELELRKIGEKLKGKQSITQEEVRKLAEESPAPKINAIVKQRGNIGAPPNWQPSLNQNARGVLQEFGVSPVVNPEDRRTLGFMVEEAGEIIDANTLKSLTPEDFGAEEANFRRLKDIVSSIQTDFDGLINYLELGTAPKFEKFTTPGGENYREILLQMERPSSARKALGGDPVELSPDEAAEKIGIMPDDFAEDSTVLYYPSGYYIEKLKSGRYITVVENRDILSRDLSEVEDFLASGMSSELGANIPTFRGGHFDEPNVLVHARVTDRKGPNGEKVLYVEEIQSDWHQSARKERDRFIADEMTRRAPDIERQTIAELDRLGASENTRENRALKNDIYNDLYKKATEEFSKTVPKDVAYAKPMNMYQGVSADDLLWEHGNKMTSDQKSWLRDYIERWDLEVDGTPAGQAAQDQLVKEYDNWINTNTLKGVPDAPFKSTSNEIAVKQILDMAANEGYDSVAFSPGSEHVKRYGMGQYFDTLLAEKKASGKINIKGIKNDRSVFDQDVSPDELGDYIGKEKAENILGQLERPAATDQAGDKLESLIEEWSKKYGESSPIRLRDKLTPEEDSQWSTLLEQSRDWTSRNMVQRGGQMVMPTPQAILKGQDLELTSSEGAGKKKIYDEIIPNFVRKYAKKEFGAEPGEIEINAGSGKTYQQYLDEINEDPYRYIDEDEVFDELHERVMDKANVKGYDFKGENADELWDQMMTREGPFEEIWMQAEQDMYQNKAKELAAKDPGAKLKAFSVPVTPQMREKITGEGQKLFAAAPVVGVQGVPFMEEAPQQAAPEPELEVEEAPMPLNDGGRVGKAKQAIEAAMKKAGQKKGQVADKDLTTIQDFQTSLGDRINEKVREKMKLMESFDYSYKPGDRVFTEWSAGNNYAPFEILSKTTTQKRFARDPNTSKILRDADGNKVEIQPEAGYLVRHQLNFDGEDIDHQYVIPEKNIKGLVEPDEPYKRGGPVGFQSGGMATPRSELEEDPFVRTVMNAARHYQAGKEIEAGQMGFAKGPVTVGINAANIIDPGTRDAMQAQALFAAYRDRLGGVDVNASVNKPAQGPDGFYQGNVMASVPVGPGRAMAGVSGYKSPQKTDVSGYNFGYGQKIGPGYASGSVFQPKDRRQDTRYDVQYTIPFQSGGAVGLQDGGRVGKTKAAAEKLLRVLHGSPTRITPEPGKAIDVTTEPSYAVKRGSDKMIGKSGPPMVNQFDIPQGRMLQFEEQYSPEDVALMRRYFNKLPQGQAMRGEEIFDAAQGRDAILEGIAKAGGFAGYERPNTGAVGKGQWFRVTEPEELVRKARGGLAQFSKHL
jgi:uncharacterized protein YidB (DUF937 family)